MPWKRAKALPPPDNTLFEACFRVQREACEAAGRRVPLVVENVRGAQRWVGRARWNYGSFYLWGDVPALMPVTLARSAAKVSGLNWSRHGEPGYKGEAFNTHAERRLRDEIKNAGGSWFNIAHNTTSGVGRNPDGRKHKGDRFRDPSCPTRQGGQRGRKYDLDKDGLKQPGINLSEVGFNVANAREFGAMVDGVKVPRTAEDKRQHIGTSRKFASAMIAKIPLPLARHIARAWYPTEVAA
jgi:hypothetical protein